MKKNMAAAVVGFIFSLGLGLAGMTNPQRIQGFLDVFGAWDPTLLFVMIGAVGLHFITYKIIRRRKSPLLTTEWHVPKNTKITASLVTGSALFGAGWGLAGYCPGPAVTSLASLQSAPFLFTGGMILGMALFKAMDLKLKFNR